MSRRFLYSNVRCELRALCWFCSIRHNVFVANKVRMRKCSWELPDQAISCRVISKFHDQNLEIYPHPKHNMMSEVVVGAPEHKCVWFLKLFRDDSFSTFAPPKFSPDVGGSPSEAWKRFEEEQANYFVATDLRNCGDERKIVILTYCLGDQEYWVICNGFDLSDDHRKVYALVMAKFSEHFEPKKLTKSYMRIFDSCYQKPKETVNECVARPRDIAEN